MLALVNTTRNPLLALQWQLYKIIQVFHGKLAAKQCTSLVLQPASLLFFS